MKGRGFRQCDNGESAIYITSSMHGKYAGGLSFYILYNDGESKSRSRTFHFTPWEAKAFVERVNREWEWAKAKRDLENKRKPSNLEKLFPKKG